MRVFVLRRLLQSLVVLLGVSFVVFFILHLTGDPAAVLLPPEASADDIRRFREAMGFDDPFLVQYARFLTGALQGDFGKSIRHGEPAFGLVLRPEIAALSMSGSSFLVAVNALMLKRLRLPEPPAEADTMPAASPARPPTPVN